jgi:hypothetical protein
MTEMRFVCRFQCGGCEHTFVLPRQSPLGISDGEQYRPMGIWPIDFLCLPHGHVCRVGREAILLDSVAALAPGLREASLWQIEYECARQNCGQHQTIYTRYLTDAHPLDVIKIVLDANARIVCKEGHVAELRADSITAYRRD